MIPLPASSTYWGAQIYRFTPAARPPYSGIEPSSVASPASVGLPAVVEEERLPYLEIRDRARNDVVTVIEVLSPSNKAVGPNREQYLAKVHRVLASSTSLVEIDLLRAGPRMPWQRIPICDYCLIVSRPENRIGDDPRADCWPLRLRDPLPVITVPLRPGDREPTLDLQAMLHRIYDAAGYQLFIYDADPDPPLPEADAAWAEQVLRPGLLPSNPSPLA